MLLLNPYNTFGRHSAFLRGGPTESISVCYKIHYVVEGNVSDSCYHATRDIKCALLERIRDPIFRNISPIMVSIIDQIKEDIRNGNC